MRLTRGRSKNTGDVACLLRNAQPAPALILRPPKAGVSKDGAKPSPQVRSSSPVIKFETSCFKTRDFVALLTLRGKVGAVAETVIPGRER